MKWHIPYEHGAWSMWITPFLIGAALSPWTILKVFLFGGSFFFFLASGSFLAFFRRRNRKDSPWPSLLIFVAAGLAFLAFPLWIHPELVFYGLLVIPLLLVNAYFAKKKKERLLTNDLAAIVALTSISLVAVHLGHGSFHPDGVVFWLLSIVFFMGSVFHVRSLIREKRNRTFKAGANLYHAAIVLLPLLLGQWWASIVFLPGALKVWFTPFDTRMRTTVIGIMEIVGSVVFVALVFMLYRPGIFPG